MRTQRVRSRLKKLLCIERHTLIHETGCTSRAYLLQAAACTGTLAIVLEHPPLDLVIIRDCALVRMGHMKNLYCLHQLVCDRLVLTTGDLSICRAPTTTALFAGTRPCPTAVRCVCKMS